MELDPAAISARYAPSDQRPLGSFLALMGTYGGTGPQKAIGELVTCPFCVGQWVATGLVFGFVVNPKVTRLVATVFTSLTAADFLQHAYTHVESPQSS